MNEYLLYSDAQTLILRRDQVKTMQSAIQGTDHKLSLKYIFGFQNKVINYMLKP